MVSDFSIASTASRVILVKYDSFVEIIIKPCLSEQIDVREMYGDEITDFCTFWDGQAALIIDTNCAEVG